MTQEICISQPLDHGKNVNPTDWTNTDRTKKCTPATMSARAWHLRFSNNPYNNERSGNPDAGTVSKNDIIRPPKDTQRKVSNKPYTLSLNKCLKLGLMFLSALPVAEAVKIYEWNCPTDAIPTLTVQQHNSSLDYLANDLETVFNNTYPKILRFALDRCDPIHNNVTLKLANLDMDAVTNKTNSTITIDPERANGRFIGEPVFPVLEGVFIRELTRLVQNASTEAEKNYPWLVDGVANYSRLLYGPVGDTLPPSAFEPGNNYTNSTEVGPYLVYLENTTPLKPGSPLDQLAETRTPKGTIVDALNLELSNSSGKFIMSDFLESTGLTFDKSWENYESFRSWENEPSYIDWKKPAGEALLVPVLIAGFGLVLFLTHRWWKRRRASGDATPFRNMLAANLRRLSRRANPDTAQPAQPPGNAPGDDIAMTIFGDSDGEV